MNQRVIAVAIDGPAGAGKSTIARAVAAKLGFVYVDTGALYRTIGLAANRRGIACDDVQAVAQMLPQITVQLCYLNGTQCVMLDGMDVSEEIRTPQISVCASQVSAIPAVRTYLLDVQRNMAAHQSVIMDGRDIGTVILPDAQVKIFLTASPEKRAARRCAELCEKGQSVTMEDVLKEMQIRDQKDFSRTVAPLRRADDAIELDTSDLTLNESIQAVLNVIARRMED